MNGVLLSSINAALILKSAEIIVDAISEKTSTREKRKARSLVVNLFNLEGIELYRRLATKH